MFDSLIVKKNEVFHLMNVVSVLDDEKFLETYAGSSCIVNVLNDSELYI